MQLSRRGGPSTKLRASRRYTREIFQREHVLVFAAGGIGAEGRDVAAIFDFHRLTGPYFRRAVGFGSAPTLNVPAIVREIFRREAQADGFAKHRAAGVAVGPASADPSQAIPSPHGAEVGLAENVVPSGKSETLRDRRGWIVRFAEDADHSCKKRLLAEVMET